MRIAVYSVQLNFCNQRTFYGQNMRIILQEIKQYENICAGMQCTKMLYKTFLNHYRETRLQLKPINLP